MSMLYIIGLGLNVKGISEQGLEAIKSCKKIYLESYTVNFPYNVKYLSNLIGKKIFIADRKKVESLDIVNEAKKENIALLVYGSPLVATTHVSLLQEAKKQKIKCEIVYNASILDAVAETGLQIYKFGKIASMPAWKKNYNPDSFMEIIKQNQSIKAHSLILTDIDLGFQEALEQLEIAAKKYNIEIKKLIVCSRLGCKDKRIIYNNINKLKTLDIKPPYCIIIPGKLHFMEEEVLEFYKI